MSTTNQLLSTFWTQLVYDVAQDFLISPARGSSGWIEVATTDDPESTPYGVDGHLINVRKHEMINRDIIGPGSVFARSLDSGAYVVVNKWSSAQLLFSSRTWESNAIWLTNRIWG